MSRSKFRIWLLFSLLSAAICLASVLLNLRQTAGVYLAKDIFDQVREETRYFASDLLWQRVDTYGHFGEWIKEKDGNKELYYSVFSKQSEVRALWRLSVGLNNKNISRVCLVANALGVNHQLFDEALTILRGAILKHQDHKRLYRFYGEMGIIYFQGMRDPIKALRHFKRSIEVLRRLNPQDYLFEDLFNIRLYAFSASVILFNANQIEEAYKYHRMGFYEPGNDQYNAAMNKMLYEKGEQQLKVIQKQRYEKIRKKHQQQGHTHSHGHGHGHGHDHHNSSNNTDHSHVEEKQTSSSAADQNSTIQTKGDKEILRGSMDRSEMENERQLMRNIFVHMIPQINSQFYLQVGAASTNLFLLLSLIPLLYLILRRKP
tara:strand:+ start:1655 stop:2776 length:1122 start_codon:yes stop_codon:yes gene_type:complete